VWLVKIWRPYHPALGLICYHSLADGNQDFLRNSVCIYNYTTKYLPGKLSVNMEYLAATLTQNFPNAHLACEYVHGTLKYAHVCRFLNLRISGNHGKPHQYAGEGVDEATEPGPLLEEDSIEVPLLPVLRLLQVPVSLVMIMLQLLV
jgi:hypothetical protein